MLKTMEVSDFNLIVMMRDIYINSNLNPITRFTRSSRSTEFKDILPYNIFEMITKTISISKKIVISYAMKQFILFCVYWKVNRKSDRNTIRITQWRESHSKIKCQKKEINSEEQDCESHSLKSEKES